MDDAAPSAVTSSMHASNAGLLVSGKREHSAHVSSVLQARYSVLHCSKSSAPDELAPPAGCKRVAIVVVVRSSIADGAKTRRSPLAMIAICAVVVAAFLKAPKPERPANDTQTTRNARGHTP